MFLTVSSIKFSLTNIFIIFPLQKNERSTERAFNRMSAPTNNNAEKPKLPLHTAGGIPHDLTNLLFKRKYAEVSKTAAITICVKYAIKASKKLV